MIAITAALVGLGAPRRVQVVVTGLTVGASYEVTAVWGSLSRQVRGGSGVSDGSTLILGDSRTPLNQPVTYRVLVGGTLTSSTPLPIPFDGKCVLESVDAEHQVAPRLIDNSLPKEPDIRAASFSVAGRRRPVVRYDVTGDGGGQLVLDTTGPQTQQMYDLLASGRPIVVRTDGAVRDMSAVEVLQVMSAPSVLTGARIQSGDTRRWTLSYVLIDEPDPTSILLLSTWDDFDTVNAPLGWDDFDLQWAGAGWDDFDRFDWEGQT